jgi:hypothetical protein
MPIVRVDDQVIGGGVPGPIAQRPAARASRPHRRDLRGRIGVGVAHARRGEHGHTRDGACGVDRVGPLPDFGRIWAYATIAVTVSSLRKPRRSSADSRRTTDA